MKLTNAFKSHPNIILAGASAGLHPRGTEDKYVDYLRYLEKSSPHVQKTKEENTLENYAQGYQDYLQMPLQVSLSYSNTTEWRLPDLSPLLQIN